ncbi:FliM/FliN family flagellar motor C-terminal domain-containing protein [Cereibacter changlensis]|uniref:FliM/FliN family flagellar motor C-terminal domain-containing protein n=1 Tax=Cereibacter changlensis TaxID=402884 RepID=UPI00403492BA
MIRRKIEASTKPADEGLAGAERGLRMALARAARDCFTLDLEVARLGCDRRSLAELLELPPELSLIAVLEGPREALGLIVLSPPVLAAMIEVQTIGKVAASPPLSRRPTRTDAAMVAGFIDRALEMLEDDLAADPDLIWAGGFRYASFLDDPRPLGLLLEDCAYRVLRAELVLALGAKTGGLLLVLPAEGRGERPAGTVDLHDPAEERAFSAALEAQVMAADCVLEGVLHRVSLPLAAVMALEPGSLLPLPMAALERIGLEGSDGRRLAEGRLGQNRGMRAVRLAPPPVAAAALEAAPLAEIELRDPDPDEAVEEEEAPAISLDFDAMDGD